MDELNEIDWDNLFPEGEFQFFEDVSPSLEDDATTGIAKENTIESWVEELLMKDDDEHDINQAQLESSNDFLWSDLLLDTEPASLPNSNSSSCSNSEDNVVKITSNCSGGDVPNFESNGEKSENDKSGDDVLDLDDDTDHDDPLSKKRKRQLRNRDAAMRSRERKKMYVKDLEIKSRYMEAECRSNLILVSRSATKLEHVACDIKHKFPNINIKMVAIDFSRDISYVTKEVKSVVKGLDVGVLVNNVGITYPKAMYVHEIDEDTWMKILRVNVGSINGVTKAILPNMLQKRKGAIINIGSGASIVVPSHPLYAIYAATKGYIDQLSRSLHVEYKSQGVDVQCQLPLYVATKMAFNVASVERPTLFIPTAEDYAVAAVRRIGYEARCTPFWAHSLQWYMASYLPNSWLDAWRLSIGIRRRSA